MTTPRTILTPVVGDARDAVAAAPRQIADLSGRYETSGDASRLQAWSEAWLAAWNAHDLDGVLALVADDFIYDDPSMMGKHLVGKDQFRDFLEAIWIAFPDMTFEVESAPYVALVGTGMAVPWRTTGTFLGKFDGPSPLRIDPTGRRFDLSGVDLYEYQDGLLSRWVSVVDSMELARQLGMVPLHTSRVFSILLRAQRTLAPLLRRRS